MIFHKRSRRAQERLADAERMARFNDAAALLVAVSEELQEKAHEAIQLVDQMEEVSSGRR